MKTLGIPDDYLGELRRRKKESRAFTEHQLVGLEVAELLGDRPHKALYIKLAKQYGKERVLTVARGVAQQKGVKKKGAYFMRVLHGGASFNHGYRHY